ncbi:acetyl-CoA C-acyltransferase [Sphingomonas histidinilytica]|jgi:acetyl-CoA acetyltransferase family protein|uniref:Acetyl-CoA C-acetyltransferase/acetyl-CoA acyltransferase n=1 Tax=Rhizorhabdus histidinilytica TaxID=439228 RepID=A0A1T5GTG5_9SPHN|nr:thiolase family protein [Rhizorhabdus histidinilytica]MBO9378923.1 acetyl-CoA C-acyltransferase [Rhizorhabdus histidinilytica]QEH77846.1 thiolase family protein [Sphingomonas sp. C8-2]SKC11713.1 acetyl-CoA C-acetyltransferase/acetyl-CoA acyltransferase [Rhizorhabdus histidinilytica]
MNNHPVIVDIVRTPMGRGKAGGQLTDIHPVDMLSQTLAALVSRNDLDPGLVDDVIVGCVTQAAEQSFTPGRIAWLAAGFPQHVPSTTVERKCGSSQQALQFAAQAIAVGDCDIVVAAGVESMSRAPMGSARMGKDPFGPAFAARFPDGLVPQGIAAELIAARWGIGREEMDIYSAESHRRAAAVHEAGGFDDEIIPVRVGDRIVGADETIRPGTDPAALAGLKPAFQHPDYERRFPEISWRITAGNSSQISDGAAAALLMSERSAVRLGLRPRARFVAHHVCGDDPLLMLTAPIPATRRVLAKAGLSIGDIDHVEVNEAFASVPLAWRRDLDADPARLNPRGGAIALGHPLGASGIRLMATMLNGLEQSGGRYGLETMCEAGGMANATIIERC